MQRAAAGAVGLACLVALAGCIAPTGFETVGRTGVTSVEGDLAVVWDTCGEEEAQSVVLYADRVGLAPNEENPEIGSWELGERNRQERIFVPSAADDPPELEASRGYIAQALPAGDYENLPGVHFTPEQVEELGPGEVLIGGHESGVVGTMEDLADC